MHSSTKERATRASVATSAILNLVFWKPQIGRLKAVPVVDVAHGLLEAELHRGDIGDGDDEALLRELLHELDEALALLGAEQVRQRARGRRRS